MRMKVEVATAPLILINTLGDNHHSDIIDKNRFVSIWYLSSNRL